jgi:hypothetical protein
LILLRAKLVIFKNKQIFFSKKEKEYICNTELSTHGRENTTAMEQIPAQGRIVREPDDASDI